MEKALTDKPHAQRSVKVKVVNAKRLDVLFHFGKETSFHFDPLRHDLVGCRGTS